MRIESCQVSWHWHLTFSFRSVLRSTLWVKKNWTLLFEHNFRKYCPILIILASNLWPSNSPDLNPVDYEIGLSCSITSTTDKLLCGWIETVAHRCLVWCSLEQSIFDEAIDQWRGKHRASLSMLKEDISSTACELTMLILFISVTFNVTFLIITSLITKSCQQRWPIHSCSFYKLVH